jgi:predicted NUDIX family NTP pyrophosphohydrolase
MAKISAGLLMYRIVDAALEVLLVHPGGPFWAKKDRGAWFIPRGQVEEGEDLFAAAGREFSEETGLVASGPFVPLGEVRHRSGKRVHAWAFAGDCDPSRIQSNTFEMEWPPKSGKLKSFPEVDRAAFFKLPEARLRILEAEISFLDRLAEHLASDPMR